LTPLEEAIAARLVDDGVLTNYQSHQLQAGRSKLNLGPYIITDWIGQGGMGQVFKAVHKVMGRQCAVKVLPLERSTELSRESFLREIRLQAGLDCPYLVRAFDAGEDGGVHYLVTEYVPGTDLRRLVRNRGPLPVAQAASVIMQAALGLDYAHRQGLIHRDVKPGNVLVTPEGHAKVSDVGLAAWSMGLEDDPRAGKIVGTADYLSPEQIRSPATIEYLSDIYSLGCTLYYALCGKVPFPGGDTPSKCRRHCEETPWHPRKFVPDLDEAFVEVIADMMEKDPRRRCASAAEVAERLEPWAHQLDDVSERPLDTGDWAAPPPAAETSGEPSGGSGEGSGRPAVLDAFPDVRGETAACRPTAPPPVLAGEPPAAPAIDSPAPTGAVSEFPASRPSVASAVAVALAIAVPLSLLIGAIIGFLVRSAL